jgi:hypothetical protein
MLGYAPVLITSYTVRSIYFDTHRMDYYYDKINGYKIRRKLRIRGYNEPSSDSMVILEIKRKINDFIDKHRAPLLYSNLEDLFISADLDSFINCKDENNLNEAKRFFFHITRDNLNPSSLVVYEREAFFSKYDFNIRITFDKNLRYKPLPVLSQLYDESMIKSTTSMTKWFLLEMKFYRGFPEAFQRIINKFRLNRIAFSKYELCISADKSVSSVTDNNCFVFSNPAWRSQVIS